MADGSPTDESKSARRVGERSPQPATHRNAHQRSEGGRRCRHLASAQSGLPLHLCGSSGGREGQIRIVDDLSRTRCDGAHSANMPHAAGPPLTISPRSMNHRRRDPHSMGHRTSGVERLARAGHSTRSLRAGNCSRQRKVRSPSISAVMNSSSVPPSASTSPIALTMMDRPPRVVSA